MIKRMISLVCSLALAFSLAVPAFAKEVKQTEVPVTLTVINAAQKISVTVPAALPVSVVEGTVVTATNAAITNNAETGSIHVVAVEVRPGALEIGNYGAFENRKNTVALSLNDCTTAQAGELPITKEAFPDIEAGKSLPIRYDAKVSAGNADKAVTAATVIFTIAAAG